MSSFSAKKIVIGAGGLVVGAAVIAFLYWTISPLFINHRVEEDFPAVASLASPETSPTPQPTSAEASPTIAAVTNTVLASSPTTAASATPEASPTPEPSPTPSEPIALLTGSFTQIDRLHGAEGRAVIYQLPDGQLVLRLEDLNAQNGPDLYVGLSGAVMPRSNQELFDQGYLELARLKGNQGNQNYELPSDLSIEQYRSVVIYCKAFSVIFSTADFEL
jgi:Electron transfer DM13.